MKEFESEPDTRLAREVIDHFLSNLSEAQRLEKVIKLEEFWSKVTIGCKSAFTADSVSEQVGKQLEELERQKKIIDGGFSGIQISERYLSEKETEN